ncbi:MAG: hypothetical protein DLM61_10965 [Pseudonocardiales bacterium]|nr:MAG: hypothetical protein DLM61_10965 [Pseudonocardiales bacterium]
MPAVIAAVAAGSGQRAQDWAMPAAEALPHILVWAQEAQLPADRDAFAADLIEHADPISEDVLLDFITAVGVRDAEEPA